MSDFRARLTEIKADIRDLLERPDLPLDTLSTSIFSDANGQEVYVEGGPNGLAYLAMQCLDIAAAIAPGAHAHVDEFSGADAGSIPLVVSLKTEVQDA
ncbi:Imm32 family immunity protein [Brevundimonas sp. FT23042]|uniref:Imm32 family immunity protein n=1 Tax=Brevundimonas sp. FT23042 TaxID=3393749 RepID=UPI003B585FB5